MSTLSLKIKPSTPITGTPPTPAHRKSRTHQVVDFSGYKARIATAAPPRKRKVSFEDLFGFKPQTIGEHMQIIRAWMDKHNLAPVPEHYTVQEFASAIQWQAKQRHEWTHFMHWEKSQARDFIRAFSAAILPAMLQAGVKK